MEKFAPLILCMVLIITFAGCTTGGKMHHNANVGTWKTAQTITPFFYENFLGDNYTVDIKPFTNPGDMKTALMAGSLNLTGTTVVTAITAASRDEPVVIVCGLSNKCSALVVSTNSSIKTVDDLKGKKIAYVPGTMHHLLLLETLSEAGLNPNKDVELIRIDFFDMGQALANGDVDAFYSGEPYPSVAVASGYGRILIYPDDKQGFGIINSVMMTTKDEIKNNPNLIQCLVTAHARATEDLNKNKAIWLNKAVEFGTRKEVLDVAAANIQLFWDIDVDYIKSVENLAQRMFEQGLITKLPDIDELFETKFIENAKKDL